MTHDSDQLLLHKRKSIQLCNARTVVAAHYSENRWQYEDIRRKNHFLGFQWKTRQFWFACSLTDNFISLAWKQQKKRDRLAPSDAPNERYPTNKKNNRRELNSSCRVLAWWRVDAMSYICTRIAGGHFRSQFLSLWFCCARSSADTMLFHSFIPFNEGFCHSSPALCRIRIPIFGWIPPW